MNGKKEGDLIKRRRSFCQKLMNREEFTAFCDRLRKSPDFRYCGGKPTDHDSRFLVPVSKLGCFPEFLMPYPYGNIKRLRIDWDVATPGRQLRIREAVATMADLEKLGIRHFNTHVTLRHGEWAFCVNTEWDLMDGDPFLIYAYVNCVVDSRDDRCSQEIGNVDSESFPRGFFKTTIQKKLSFLKGIRVTPRSWGLNIAENHLENFWSAFSQWCEDGAEASIESATFRFIFIKNEAFYIPIGGLGSKLMTGHQWDEEVVSGLIRQTGGGDRECMFQIQIDLGEAPEGMDCEEEYHAWLTELVGLETLSGRAATFLLAVSDFGGRFGGGVSGHFVPDGVAIAYYQYEGRPRNTPPKELQALLPGEDWVLGIPPGGDSFPFPVYGIDEADEPLAGTDAKAAIRFLRKEAAKWKRTQPNIEPGTVEDQLRQFAGVGLRIASTCDLDDLFEFRERKWYEENPYIGLLIWACHGSGRLGKRMEYADYDHGDAGTPIYEMLLRYDLAGLLWHDPDGQCAEANATGGRKVITFMKNDNIDTLCRWEFEKPLEWVTPEYFRRYDDMLKGSTGMLSIGKRVYSLPVGPNSVVLGAFQTEEAEKINSLLPVPFKLINP